jgi:hypothetical protein
MVRLIRASGAVCWAILGVVGVVAIVVCVLAAVSEVVLPLVLSAALAIVFGPLCRRLVARGWRPGLAALVIVSGLVRSRETLARWPADHTYRLAGLDRLVEVLDHALRAKVDQISRHGRDAREVMAVGLDSRLRVIDRKRDRKSCFREPQIESAGAREQAHDLRQRHAVRIPLVSPLHTRLLVGTVRARQADRPSLHHDVRGRCIDEPP